MEMLIILKENKREKIFRELIEHVENKTKLKVSSNIDSFQNLSSKTVFECECGETFVCPAERIKHSKKTTCNTCARIGRKAPNKTSYAEVFKTVSEYGLNLLTPENEYIDTTIKITIECKCGTHFDITFIGLKRKKRKECHNCRVRTTILYEDISNFVEKESLCSLVTKEIDYKNSREKIAFKCSYGNIFRASFKTFRDANKRECNTCSLNLTTIKDFENEFKYNVELSKCILVSYESKDGIIRSHDKVTMECECGEKFTVNKRSIFQHGSTRCGVCTKLLSKGERKVGTYLNSNHIKNEEQYRFSDCRGIRLPLPF